MDIQIIENAKEALKVIIRCSQTDDEVLRLKEHIERFDKKLQAKKNGERHFVSPSEVLYFESVDDRTFLYTMNEVMELRQRLYELENILSGKDFIRISKSQIANINKITSLKPEINRTVTATMCSGEKLCISRKYVPALRSLLSV